MVIRRAICKCKGINVIKWLALKHFMREVLGSCPCQCYKVDLPDIPCAPMPYRKYFSCVVGRHTTCIHVNTQQAMTGPSNPLCFVSNKMTFPNENNPVFSGISCAARSTFTSKCCTGGNAYWFQDTKIISEKRKNVEPEGCSGF